jgi:hypothetical protein
VFFVEFKREGMKPTPAQQREHDRLREQGVLVYVIDDVMAGHIMVCHGSSVYVNLPTNRNTTDGANTTQTINIQTGHWTLSNGHRALVDPSSDN